ncbi:Hyalin [Holothuria leucospilota]|uniref:Hyalin n=1 Tax=Holothuria leucospilota TaxID=206669 RepID=A0A9Q1CCM0_HOLLE|nr:Hyalin [Holothuria leucospilota]
MCENELFCMDVIFELLLFLGDDVSPVVDCSGEGIMLTAPAGASGVTVETLPRCRATDNSGQVNFVSQSPSPGSFFLIGDTMVTVVYRDPSGNTGVGFFTVTVRAGDDVSPVVDCSGEGIMLTAPAGASGVTVETLPRCRATDNSGQVNFVSQSPSPGYFFLIGDTMVTVVYRDPSGNTGVGFFTVTVRAGDDVSPVVDCSGEGIMLTTPAGASGVTVETLPRCRATDNSGQVNFVSQSPSPGSFFLIGDTMVTVVYRDPSGNTGVGFFTVTVRAGDDVSPVVDCSGEGIMLTAQAGASGVTVETLPRCRATDNSGQVNFVSQSPSPGSFFLIGDTMVTVVYRDPSGNTGVGFFTVTVRAGKFLPSFITSLFKCNLKR